MLRGALTYYVENRNRAPSSKRTLESILTVHLMDWMALPILTIDATMLQVRYREVIAKVKANGNKLAKQYRRLTEDERLLVASDGYYTGVRSGHDMIEGFGRVYRYWITKHMARLQRGGILVPACPTTALIDDLIPLPQRVKSIPRDELRRLVVSFPHYSGRTERAYLQ
jgi:hypothetical protein